MTLNTRIYILEPTDIGEVFDHCRRLLADFSTDAPSFADQRTSDVEDYSDKGVRIRQTNPGQGLPAWLEVTYRPDAPLRTPAESARHDPEDCDPDCDGSGHLQPCAFEVSFDTAYGYRGPGGEDCGMLHVFLVSRLGLWLDHRDIKWKWMNEYTGDVYEGYNGLATLVEGTEHMKEWFEQKVKPAILGIGGMLL